MDQTKEFNRMYEALREGYLAEQEAKQGYEDKKFNGKDFANTFSGKDKCTHWKDGEHCYVPFPKMTESGANVQEWICKHCACGAEIQKKKIRNG